MSQELCCAVAEDEPEARSNLAEYLERLDAVSIVGVAGDGEAAVRLVDETRPDLLFLDVCLPEMDGFEVLRRIRHRPEVVFTTAFDDYAVSAFEMGALDYLVKPFGPTRLEAAVERVRSRLSARPGEPGAPGPVERALTVTRNPVRRLFARQGGRIVPIEADDILRISASGEYSEIVTERSSFLVASSLAQLAGSLDPADFERVHRAHIVNFRAVRHLRPAGDRRLQITLKDGSTLVASRAASVRLRQRIA
ncbi:MAG: response regulator transcription factor [Acidobacteria bacterium]|nr:response regulator transcription factor [Acidobacteriota bacterium]MCG3194914.1 Transcriptional regulatory protein YpdB [Thermoanaerobaculia bacterium]